MKTLEEVAKKEYPVYMHYGESTVLYDDNEELREAFIDGAKWQQERSYSEEDMEEMYNYGYNNYLPYEQAIEKFRKTK